MPIIARSPLNNARVPFHNQHQPLPEIEYQFHYESSTVDISLFLIALASFNCDIFTWNSAVVIPT